MRSHSPRWSRFLRETEFLVLDEDTYVFTVPYRPLVPIEEGIETRGMLRVSPRSS